MPDLNALLGQNGLLATSLPGYEHRPGQEAMMRRVADAIARREVLLVEAGTGVGKSIAYLVPAVLSREQVLVSTGTKTLQQQLYFKDIPLLRDRLGLKFTAAILKGRTNYLCLELLDQAWLDTEVKSRYPKGLSRLQAWSEETETGDRAELADLPDDSPLWPLVSTAADGCLGQGCPKYTACFVMKARRRAAAANVVVVNHHLYFADLSLREGRGFALLPETDVVIFDEAHNLEDIAASFFGESVSDYRIRDLVSDVRRQLRLHQLDGRDTDQKLDRVSELTKEFFDCYEPFLPKSRLHADELPHGLIETFYELDNALAAVEGVCAAHRNTDEAIERLTDRTAELRGSLDRLALVEERSRVTWVETGARATFVRSAPINVAGVLQETLFSRVEALVFTSATLTTDGNFSHIKSRLGIDFECAGEQVASPFDYGEQALFYTPDDLPRPHERVFLDRACERIGELLRLTRGRAFVLFTSYANMRGAHELLASGLPYPVMMQGEGSREALLERFKAEPGSVLFATGSFWEGVDVVGDALSMVIIDKLPFASPDDPITSARIEWMKANHRNPFMDYQVPAAAIALKQGFGRLIRKRTDRGIVAVLDKRIVQARYGRVFLSSLPPAHQVVSLPELEALWRERDPAEKA